MSHTCSHVFYIWIGFCITGHISLIFHLFVFVCILCVLFHTAYLLYYCEHGGVDLRVLKPNSENPIFLQCFDIVGLVICS